jgi:hypothetical protein
VRSSEFEDLGIRYIILGYEKGVANITLGEVGYISFDGDHAGHLSSMAMAIITLILDARLYIFRAT